MAKTSLHSLEELTGRLVAELRSAGPELDNQWQVEGPVGASKLEFLAELRHGLHKEGLKLVTVTPPRRAADTGPFGLVQTGVGLRAEGLINGSLVTLTQADRNWSEKVGRVHDWLEMTKGELVLLCDEPADWASQRSEDARFREHTEELVTTLLSARVRRVVVGDGGGRFRFRSSFFLRRPTGTLAWLRDGGAWRSLAGVARSLADRLETQQVEPSQLRVRLLVALSALRNGPPLTGCLPDARNSFQELLQALTAALQEERGNATLRDLWATLSLVRLPFDGALLARLGEKAIDQGKQDILELCLLNDWKGLLEMPSVLRVDSRDLGWPVEKTRAAHLELAEYYAAKFAALQRADDAQALLAEMEAFHHATGGADPRAHERFRVFFVDQLDALGKSLSLAGQYDQAAAVFRRGLEWDPVDDYAHHYLAYNLDVRGREVGDVEAHYRRAVELNGTNPWWWSRWITFLITLGRMEEARAAWSRALDELGLPEPDAPPAVYDTLHKWVARLLIHRGVLAFADDVLRTIPPDVVGSHPGFRAMCERLQALLYAENDEVVFPLWVPISSWWKGPHLNSPLHRTKSLKLWLPGRVERVDEKELQLFVGKPPKNGERPQFGYMTLPVARYNQVSQDELTTTLKPGRFVELAYYGEDGDLVARAHPDKWWEDPDLPPLYPDPQRYLRAEGLVR
jgi:tetratricopeptide (TPR) repeat protein